MAISPQEVTITPPPTTESDSMRRSESPEAQRLIAYIEARINAALRGEEGSANVKVRNMVEAVKKQIVRTTRYNMNIEVSLKDGDTQIWSNEILSRVPTGVKNALIENYRKAGWARVCVVIYNTYDEKTSDRIFTGKRFEIGLTNIHDVVRDIES